MFHLKGDFERWTGQCEETSQLSNEMKLGDTFLILAALHEL